MLFRSDGTELQLALNNNPAAKAYQHAIFQQGQKCSIARSSLHSRQRCQMPRFVRLQNLLPLSALIAILSVRCQRIRGVPLGMRRIHPECLDPETSDRSVAADVLVREEPDEEDDDEERDGEEKEGEEEDDEGYSE